MLSEAHEALSLHAFGGDTSPRHVVSEKSICPYGEEITSHPLGSGEPFFLIEYNNPHIV